MRSEPAAALRGLAKVRFPSSICRRFRRAKASRGITTSPRTSKSRGTLAFRRAAGSTDSGSDRRVRAFRVMTSPSTPSPRVSARSSRPDTKRTAIEAPSSFSSPT